MWILFGSEKKLLFELSKKSTPKWNEQSVFLLYGERSVAEENQIEKRFRLTRREADKEKSGGVCVFQDIS